MSREYPCVYYKDQKCEKFAEPGYVSWCVMGPCSHETPSNADRIRAMSDEELADYLANYEHNIETNVYTSLDCKAWLRWLQQPVEGGL